MQKLFAAYVLVPVAALASANVVAADTCALLSQTDAAAVLGQAVEQVTLAGPQRDEDSGGQLTYCTYRGASAAVVVSVVEFASTIEARKQVTSNAVQERMNANSDQVSRERGPGEKSFYGFSGRGSLFLFLKENKVVGVEISGLQQNRSVTKESLRSITQLVASKV